MRVGIVVPAYDVAPYVSAAIASIRAQSHKDWALVVVDDGSRDGTAAVASRALEGEARAALIRQANAGVSAARNRGLAALPPCDAVLFLDADDWLAPDAVARLAATLARVPRAVAAVGAHAFVDGGAIVETRRAKGGDVLARLLERNLFANGGHLLLRSTSVTAVGGFRTDLRYGEDWDYWVRLALRGPFAADPSPAPVLFVRRRPTGAYLRLAHDRSSFSACMAAIHGNPDLAARFSPARRAALLRRAEAENAWIVGRELLRHGRGDGLARLRAAFRAKPGAKRALLLAAAHVLPLLPARLHGPFRAYAATEAG
jgi:glycosyltransferase involved in cell wall biosynthesis